MASATSFYDFEPLDSTPPPLRPLTYIPPPSRARAPANPPTEKGQPYPLSTLKNKVVLIVNTASKCGFTPQFEGLETLYKKIKEKYPDDFIILGFPCNQFMNQDPVRPSPLPIPFQTLTKTLHTPGRQRHHPILLPSQLRCHLPRPLQTRRQRPHRLPALRIPESCRARPPRLEAREMEFRKVFGWEGWRGEGEMGEYDEAGGVGGEDFGGVGEGGECTEEE